MLNVAMHRHKHSVVLLLNCLSGIWCIIKESVLRGLYHMLVAQALIALAMVSASCSAEAEA